MNTPASAVLCLISSDLSDIHRDEREQENQDRASNRQHVRHFVRDSFNHIFRLVSGVVVSGWARV